jgi:subtilase family serine protease
MAVAALVAAVAGLGAGAASARTLVQLIPHRYAQPPNTAECETFLGVACYDPFQFQQAYGLNTLYGEGITGAGRTFVIVDSFGSPTIRDDLAKFDSDNGLPAPPSFKIITPAGTPPPYDPTDASMGGWAVETSLDVEYAHAFAPGANILLVETPIAETEGVQGFPQMMSAERYVVDHNLGDVISQSFGATEQTFQNDKGSLNPALIYRLRYAFMDAAAHHVTVLAGSGDFGASNAELDGVTLYPQPVISWPSSDPLVTSVGGTQLHLDPNGNRLPDQPDNVWNDSALFGSPAASGGGVSAVFERPFYQNSVSSVVGDQRGTPDVSLSAAVNGGAVVYLGFTNLAYGGGITPGYYIIGGTSEATPEMAGIVALADQAAHHRVGLINPSLYQLGDGPGSGITDITLGNNIVTVNGASFGYNAGPGYDLASGLGTPAGATLVPQLAALPAHGG